MKKMVITNRKGGVGKTTTVFNLAWYFVQKGLKVLVIDTDGQQDLKKSFGVTNIKNTLGDYLLGRVNDFDPIIINDKLHFIGAGSDENVSNDMTALQNKTPMCFKMLNKFLNIIADDYDTAIIDTAPALNLYTKSAIYTSDSVYIPMLAGTNEIFAKHKTGCWRKWLKKIGIKKDKANIAIRKYKLYLQGKYIWKENQQVLELPDRAVEKITNADTVFVETDITEIISAENPKEKFKDIDSQKSIKNNETKEFLQKELKRKEKQLNKIKEEIKNIKEKLQRASCRSWPIRYITQFLSTL